jgi:hypothetical protein
MARVESVTAGKGSRRGLDDATGASRSALIRRALRATYGANQSRPPLTFVGVVSDGSLDPERIDETLAEAYDSKTG